jgi:ABC-2 type transport system permease protein
MFDRVRTLIVKEIRTILRDPQGRRLLVVPIILQLVLFPFAATLEVKNSALGILNQDAGGASLELVNRLAHTQAFTKIVMLHGETEMRHAIDAQQVLVAIQFPSDFSRRVESSAPADLQVIIDGRRSNSAQIAYSYAQSIIDNYAAERAATSEEATPSVIQVQNLYNPNLEFRWFLLPALVAIITTIGSLIVTALSVAREREQGTFDQLLVSPLTPGLIMFGKAVPAMLVACGQATVIILAAVFAFQVPFFGSLVLLYFGMLVYAVSLVGFGLLISSFCSTQQQAFLGVFSFMVPAILLSGFMAPVENMPLPFQYLSWIDPLSHFILIVRGVFLKNIGWNLVWHQTWPMLTVCACTLSSSYILFKRNAQ